MHSSRSLEEMLILMMGRTGPWTNTRLGHQDNSLVSRLLSILLTPGCEFAAVSCPWAGPQPGSAPLQQVWGHDVSIPQGTTWEEINQFVCHGGSTFQGWKPNLSLDSDDIRAVKALYGNQVLRATSSRSSPYQRPTTRKPTTKRPRNYYYYELLKK